MARGRGNRPGVTLFAFQDVIMSVSGIILIMVLVLTLELVERAASAPVIHSAAVATRIADAIDEARDEIGELEAELGISDDLVRELAAVSPEQLKEQITANQERLAQLREEIPRLQAQLDAARVAEQAAEASLFDARELQDQLAAIQERIETLQQQLEQEQQADRRLFSLPRGFQGQGWLVVVEQDEIQVAPLGRVAVPQRFRSSRSGSFSSSSASDQFLAWIDTHSGRTSYFLLLIRPSGHFSYFTLHEQLSRRGIRYGYDLIGRDETVLDPERGAGT